MTDADITKSMQAFHAHLDVCKQCRDNPFGLCKTGEALLLATAEEDALVGAHRLFGLTPTKGGKADG